MPLIPERPRFGADGANLGGSGNIESNQPLARIDALRQPGPLVTFEPPTLDELKQALGSEAVEIGEGDQRKLIHTTSAEDPFTHHIVTSTTTFNNDGLMESILSQWDDDTPAAYITYHYEKPDNTHYQLTGLQTYLQEEPDPSDPSGQVKRYPIEGSQFSRSTKNGQSIFDTEFSSYEGEPLKDELQATLQGVLPMRGGPAQDGSAAIARAREVARKHPAYKVIDNPDGTVTIKSFTVDRGQSAYAPTRFAIMEATFDHNNRLDTLVTNAHPLRPNIDIASQAVTQYSYENGYVSKQVETFAGATVTYTYDQREFTAPDGRQVSIPYTMTVENNGLETTIDLDVLRTSPVIDSDSDFVRYQDYLGYNTTTMDHQDGSRHISLYGLQPDLELVVDHPGPNATITLQRKETN